MAGLALAKKRLVALILAVALVIALVLVAATSGLGHPGVPEGAVAFVEEVDDGEITRERFDRGMEQAAARVGLGEVPPESDPQWEQLKDETMQGLLLEVWAEGEAADRGIEVTEADVQAELDTVLESFESPKEFARVARESRFCTEEEIEADTPATECADVVRQGRLLALQRKLSEAFSVTSEIGPDEARDFYEDNIESFQRPATRDVRVILNENRGPLEQALEQLEGLSPEDEDFARQWRQAAKEFSQDQASKDRGGLLEGLVEGQGDPQLEEQAFSAEVGEIVGPFETDRGFYLIQVVDSTEASTQPFEEAEQTIIQQLTAARQQASQNEIQNDFIVKWTRRTECIPLVRMGFCSGFTPPEPESIPGQPEPPAPPPVPSTRPIAPGTAQSSIDGSTQTGQPQGPRVFVPEGDAAAGGGLPQDAVPIGPDGAPAPPAP